ncbi:phage tail protein [Croceivirga thetidis]|uniref:Phage tail protein n=1 Tax=Croceivirga thetidis TaxID=2721623 RepID=A0ABX1GPV3_9FLAO|nr:tail fiber protein [Croceivirga thetidis]NKI31948.1 phage tail protein [Croceivirga thetidis]
MAVDPLLGQLMTVGFNFAPRGWARCEGQLLAIAQYSALFSLLGTTYGGDGRTSFGLPDLRGRSIIGVGSGPGLGTIQWGEKNGVEDVTLTIQNLPPHNHAIAIPVSDETGEESDPTSNVIASRTDGFKSTPNTTLNGNAAATTANTGGGVAINIRNPYLGMYTCIALQGIFPSRS